MPVRLPFVLTFTFLLTACAGTKPVIPALELSPNFDLSGNNTDSDQVSADTADISISEKWWLDFSDPQLNVLINQALKSNYSLQASLARLRQSQSRWDQAGSEKIPDLQLTAQQSRQWQDGLQQPSTTKDQWQVGLSARYELDFWGRIASLDEQALQQLNASRAAKNIQTNTVVSQLAIAWYGWLQESQQLALLQRQQARNKNALNVVQGRYLRGKVNASDMWQQEQLLESISSDIIRSKTAQTLYQQQLALWLGEGKFEVGNLFETKSTGLSINESHIPHFTQAIAQVSSESLQQRPDVKQAYAQIMVAHAGLNVAESNRYPRFTLSASYTSAVDNPSDVLKNWMANLIAGLAVPLIDGDNLRAEVRRNEAVVEEAIANYQQVLLVAMQEIEQALINESQQFSLSTSLATQLKLANKTQQYLSQRYQNGAGDFLSLLNNQQDVLTLERQVLAAEYQQLQYRIQLLTSLSHGRFSESEFSEDRIIDDGSDKHGS
jgi:NodT family efflux transporter outer membrane factor (OMF) lipoprotein